MKKSIMVILLVISLIKSSKAQTFAEWFQQKSTQKKYLLQQIVALETFSIYLKQGYKIADKGLGSISGSLKSENGLHSTYYNRMEIAGAPVKNSDQVKEILSWQKDILNILNAIDQINGLSMQEKNYLANVRTEVLKDCEQQINTLQNVITDGKMKMSDADRLSLINKIHTALQDNYHFTIGFTNQAKAYALQRQREQNDVLVVKQINGIN